MVRLRQSSLEQFLQLCGFLGRKLRITIIGLIKDAFSLELFKQAKGANHFTRTDRPKTMLISADDIGSNGLAIDYGVTGIGEPWG